MDTNYNLLLEFDTDSTEFRRGLEVGNAWASLHCGYERQFQVHADCTEMMMRIGEALCLKYTAEMINEDWILVTYAED